MWLGARTVTKNRVEKLLEEACISFSVVISDIHGVSGRAMMDAMITGKRDPKVLADMAKSRMRPKIRLLEDAFAGLKVGTFDTQHRFRLQLMLDRIDRDDATSRPSMPRSKPCSTLSLTRSPGSMRSPGSVPQQQQSSSPRSVST